MNDDKVTIDWVEFDDPDDPRSRKHPDHDGGIRISFAPEGMVLVMPNAKNLAREDTQALGKLLRLVYYQGKEVGKKLDVNVAPEICDLSGCTRKAELYEHMNEKWLCRTCFGLPEFDVEKLDISDRDDIREAMNAMKPGDQVEVQGSESSMTIGVPSLESDMPSDDERRDDKKLISLACPHCGEVVPTLQVDAFEKQQLLYMVCPNCAKGITKDQIDAAYREYRP